MISNLPPRGVLPETGGPGPNQGPTQPAPGVTGNYYGPGTYNGYPPPGYVMGQPDYTGRLQKKSFPVWGWISLVAAAVVVFVVVLVTAILLFVFSRPNVTESFGGVNYFYNSLQRHNYDEAHRMLSSSLAGQYTPAGLKAQWETLEKANGGSLSMDITNFEIQDNAAKFSISLKGETGKRYPLTVNLNKTAENNFRITGPSPGFIPAP